MSELKPCPFCGERETLKPWQADAIEYWTVICESCVAEGPTSITEAEAIAAWNARSAPRYEELLKLAEGMNRWILVALNPKDATDVGAHVDLGLGIAQQFRAFLQRQKDTEHG